MSRMHAMLEASKKAELDEALKQQQMRLAQQENDRRMAEELVRASAVSNPLLCHLHPPFVASILTV